MSKIATRESYGKALAALALENKNVVCVDADLSGSTKTSEMKKVAPERHFNVGIAEADLIGVSAGLAASGKIPYCSTFAMFASARCLDQVRNTVAYSKLNVKICATHAGITVGEDGATHQALEDLAYMRAVPNMVVVQPCDDIETQQTIKAISEYNGPCYVRLGRSAVQDVNDENYQFDLFKGVVVHQGSSDITMFATGIMVAESLKALEILKENGIDPTIINIHTIKPIDEQLILEYASKSKLIVSLEEHSIIGGLGSAISEVTSKYHPVRQLFIGTNDTFGESGKPDQLLEKYGLSSNKIAEKILKEYK